MKKAALLFFVLISFFFPVVVAAQEFQGSDITNYYCPGKVNEDGVFEPGPAVRVVNEDFVCDYDGDGRIDGRAVPRPPTLRQVEYWFIRVVYVAWAAAGIIFTGILMWIGWLYMTSFNNEFLMADVIKRARNWFIGLALVFLAYPILATFFNVLGLKQSECFEDLQLPGFTFFFANACRFDTPEALQQCLNACQELTDGLERVQCENACNQ